jgi:putative oxygen-independent coproporphyrinogen III oxidase
MTDPLDPGFGVYVHWPFCAAKCPYCDFNSHVRAAIDEARFTRALLREIATLAARMPGRPVTSVFFGGGTPSLMSAATVGAVLDAIARHWPLAADAEVTLEANPSSVEAERFAGYRAAGVGRVSLGVQSLDDAALRRLGRLHDVAEARAAIALAHRHFSRVSFDLIYARPGQSLAQWRAELGAALALAADHLSLYQLTIEAGTPYRALYDAGKLVLPDGDLAGEFYEVTQELTGAAGLPAYEISNHAVPGEESRHNLLYWRYGTYAGIGAGAHGRLLEDGRRIATVAERSPEAWLAAVEAQGHGIVEETPLEPAEMADEMLVMGLRLAEGLDLARFEATARRTPDPGVLAALRRAGILAPEDAGRRLVVAPAHRLVLDRVVVEIAAGLRPLASTA